VVRVAQTVFSPALSVDQLVPLTEVGAARIVVSPTPSWPLPLLPQHCSAPVVRMAQV